MSRKLRNDPAHDKHSMIRTGIYCRPFVKIYVIPELKLAIQRPALRSPDGRDEGDFLATGPASSCIQPSDTSPRKGLPCAIRSIRGAFGF